MEQSTTNIKKQKSFTKVTTYEHGAYFKYMDLFSALVNLITSLPQEQIGNNGIYFQEDNKSSLIPIQHKSMFSLLKLKKKNRMNLHLNDISLYDKKQCSFNIFNSTFNNKVISPIKHNITFNSRSNSNNQTHKKIQSYNKTCTKGCVNLKLKNNIRNHCNNNIRVKRFVPFKNYVQNKVENHNCKYKGFNFSSINSLSSLSTNVNNNRQKMKFPTITFTSNKLIQKNKVHFYPGSPHLNPFLSYKGNTLITNANILVNTTDK